MVQDYVSIVQTAELNCQLVRTIATEKADSRLKKHPECLPRTTVVRKKKCLKVLHYRSLYGGVALLSCSDVSDPLRPHGQAHQAPLSIGFSRKTYWSGLLFTSPLDLPYRGIKPRSPALQAVSLLSEPPEKPIVLVRNLLKRKYTERLRILRRYMDTYMYTLSKSEIFAIVKKHLVRKICVEKMQK